MSPRVVVIACLLLAGCASSSDERRHFTVVAGMRRLNEEAAKRGDVRDQPMVALEVDSHNADGHGWEAGISRSQNHDHMDEVFPVGADLTGISFGYRYTFFEGEVLQPFVSAGLTAMHGDIDFGNGDDDDGWAPCPYLRAGLLWHLGEGWRLGAEYRHGFGKFHFSGEDFDADFDQVAMSVGFAF